MIGIEDAAGEIAIDVKFAAALVTVKVAFDLIVPEVAVIVTVPEADAVARPLAATLAIVESDEFHVTEPVTSLELPSDIFAVAVNCCVAPVPIDIDAGVT